MGLGLAEDEENGRNLRPVLTVSSSPSSTSPDSAGTRRSVPPLRLLLIARAGLLSAHTRWAGTESHVALGIGSRCSGREMEDL